MQQCAAIVVGNCMMFVLLHYDMNIAVEVLCQKKDTLWNQEKYSYN